MERKWSSNRCLLIFCGALIATTAFAQDMSPSAEQIEEVVCHTIEGGSVVAENVSLFNLGSSQRHSKESGLYYAKPRGAMYRHWYSYSGTYTVSGTQLYVPYFKTFTYVNMSSSPSQVNWWLNTSDASSYVDEEYNFTIMNELGGNTYIPNISSADKTEYFSMNENTSKTSICGGTGYYMNVSYCDDNYFGWMAFVDRTTIYNSGDIFSNNTHLMGSGTYTGTLMGLDSDGNEVEETGTFVADAIYQSFPAPISPIYVDCVYLRGVTSDSSIDPLQNGATLTMEIYDYYTHELLHTLTATTGSFRNWISGTNGVMKFVKKSIDPMYGIIEKPFTLDRAVGIKISGFDQDGVDFGITAAPIHDWDAEEELSEVYMSFKPSGQIVTPYLYHYSNPIIASDMKFNAVMDNLDVASDFSVLRISDDGTTCTNDDVAEEDNFGGVYVRTTCEWGYNNLDNYTIVDCPDWVIGVYPKVLDYSLTNTYIVAFEAEPLPSDLKGRGAIVRIKGRGIKNETPIYIIQGDIDKDDIVDGIASIPTSSSAHQTAIGTYNLLGQKVNDMAKGLVIKDGKKIFKR